MPANVSPARSVAATVLSQLSHGAGAAPPSIKPLALQRVQGKLVRGSRVRSRDATNNTCVLKLAIEHRSDAVLP